MYSQKLRDHFDNPQNVGSFDKKDNNVGTGLVGAPACGDVMKLQIKVNGDGIINDAKFKTFGCGSAIASSSLITEWVKGKTLDEAIAKVAKETHKGPKMLKKHYYKEPENMKIKRSNELSQILEFKRKQ